MKKLMIGLTLLCSFSAFAGVTFSKQFMDASRIEVLKLASELYFDNSTNNVSLTYTKMVKIGYSDVIEYQVKFNNKCKIMGYDIQLEAPLSYPDNDCI
jgi:hypothetical protein